MVAEIVRSHEKLRRLALGTFEKVTQDGAIV